MDCIDRSLIVKQHFAPVIDHVEVNPLLDVVIRSLHYQAKARGIQIQLLSKGENHGLIKIDSLRVQQIMYILLQNAIQASPDRESVTVRTTMIPEMDEKVRLMIFVRDNGKGLEPELLQQCFRESFFEADPHKDSDPRLGIDMKLAKMIADCLQAQI